MWLKVGSYPERELAMEVASKLRDAGAKVEIKEFMDWEIEEKYILQTRIDMVEGHDAEEWKRYAQILRELVKENLDVETFERKFLRRAHPEKFELVEKLKDENLMDDEFMDAVEVALELSFIMSSVYSFLRLNGVEIGDRVFGELPENPEVVLEFDEEVEGSRKIYHLDFTPIWEVNVDVLSVIKSGVRIEGLEGMVIDAASRVLMNLLLGVEERGNVEDLSEYAVGIIESDDGEIYVDAEDAVETMLKSLEKAGIVRIFGKKVRLRGK